MYIFNYLIILVFSLEKIGENIGELNLSVNVLTELPDFISKFTRLKYLNLSGNALNNLPETLCECQHLRELIISNNK